MQATIDDTTLSLGDARQALATAQRKIETIELLPKPTLGSLHQLTNVPCNAPPSQTTGKRKASSYISRPLLPNPTKAVSAPPAIQTVGSGDGADDEENEDIVIDQDLVDTARSSFGPARLHPATPLPEYLVFVANLLCFRLGMLCLRSKECRPCREVLSRTCLVPYLALTLMLLPSVSATAPEPLRVLTLNCSGLGSNQLKQATVAAILTGTTLAIPRVQIIRPHVAVLTETH
jgi:hypothetical protein